MRRDYYKTMTKCKKCGKEVETTSLILTVIPPIHVEEYYCPYCGDHGRVSPEETYVKSFELGQSAAVDSSDIADNILSLNGEKLEGHILDLSKVISPAIGYEDENGNPILLETDEQKRLNKLEGEMSELKETISEMKYKIDQLLEK